MNPSHFATITGFQMRDKSTEPPGTVNKRRPYLNLPGGESPRCLNGKLQFANTKDIDPENVTICCRHLALLYGEYTLADPRFQPEAIFDTVDPRQADASALVGTLNHLNRHSRQWHLLPSHRFGEFLALAFHDLIQRGTAEWSLFLAASIQHMMALRLRVKPLAHGGRELVVQVYDPNITQKQITARAQDPQDWRDAGAPGHFVDFLSAQVESPQERHRQMEAYFTTLDPDAHLALFELQDDGAGRWVQRDAPCPLVTNWCTNSRVQLFFAAEFHNPVELEAALNRYFADTAVDALANPTRLLEVPGVDGSVLLSVVLATNGAGQAPWQACWEGVDDLALKVRLLRGLDFQGDHLLRFAHQCPPEALSWWFGLVTTLPAQAMLEVLKVSDDLGYFALHFWLETHADTVPNPWPAILQATRAWRPSVVRQLLACVDHEGNHLLQRYTQEDDLAPLRVWGELLDHVSLGDRQYLLLAQSPDGSSALHIAMQSHAHQWIAMWGEWCQALNPPVRAHLLRGMGPEGRPGLHALAIDYDRDTLQAWIVLWQDLPEPLRTDVLAGVVEDPPCLPVLYRAMTGAQVYLDEPEPGSTAFIRHWGSCLALLPVDTALTLLEGRRPRGESALMRGLSTGHWEAVVAWAELLNGLSPETQASLIDRCLAGVPLPLLDLARQHVRVAPDGVQAMVSALGETLSPAALAPLRELIDRQ